MRCHPPTQEASTACFFVAGGGLALDREKAGQWPGLRCGWAVLRVGRSQSSSGRLAPFGAKPKSMSAWQLSTSQLMPMVASW